MRKYKQAIRIGDNNIIDVFYLPCVKNVIKSASVRFFFGLYNGEYANIGNWLLEDVCGNWHVMTDEEYHKHKDDEI